MAELKKRMYDYWLKQPEVMRHILNNRKALVHEFVSVYQDVCPSHLYLVGTGTSFNACRCAAPLMNDILRQNVSAVMSSRIPKTVDHNPLFVFLSQGGSSINTLDAMSQLEKWPSIAVTGEEESEMARRSKHPMPIGCGEEKAGPKTIGYTASVLNLTLCALEAGLSSGKITQSEYDAKMNLLWTAAGNMDTNIQKTEAWFDQNKEVFLNIHKYVVLGRGSASDVAAEAALKMLETLKVPVLSFELDEYLHGPILITDDELAAIFFISEDHEKQRMLDLACCHAHFSKYTFLIAGDEQVLNKSSLHIQITGDELTACYEYILAPQLISARIPEMRNLPDGVGAGILDHYSKKWPVKYNG